MKKFFRVFLIMLILPMSFLFSACEREYDDDDLRIKSIEQISTTRDSASYLITYNDGETLEFTIPLNNAVSIETIEKTGSNLNVDTYTITLTNGETTQFDVANGVSITGIRFDRTEGLKDYYIISYSNNTTYEYAVTNGSQGVSLEDMYNEAKKEKDYNNITEFIEDYLNINVDTNSTAYATGKSLLSAVSIYSRFSDTGYSYSYDFEKYVQVKSTSAGAGVIYNLDKENGDAYIITNAHVVYNEGRLKDEYSSEVYCYLYGMEGDTPYTYLLNDTETDYLYDEDSCVQVQFNNYAIPCTVIGASIKYDLAVLKVKNSSIIKNSNARACEIEDSNDVIVGSTAIAVGNPDAGGISATAGVISVISEYIQVGIDEDIDTVLREFRIDTAVNSGNSGGGLFNSNGKFIGVVNAKTSNDSIENMGYAIPGNIAKNVADNIIDNYEKDEFFGVKRAKIGIVLEALTSTAIYDTNTFTTKIVETIAIDEVLEDSIAENMGFNPGDIIRSVEITRGEETTPYTFTRYFQLIDLILTIREGDTMTFYVTTSTGDTSYSHTFVASDFIVFQ